MIYREDGWKAEVEVVADNSDAEWTRYTLKVVKTLRDSPLYKSPPDGDVFSVDALKNSGAYAGMWHLSEE